MTDDPNNALQNSVLATRFPATRWSLVLEAKSKEPERAEKALNELCEIYWTPLFLYFRNRLSDDSEAEDFTQEFIATLIDRDSLDSVSQQNGKLRSFLLASAGNFYASALRKRYARKRGGNSPHVELSQADQKHASDTFLPDSEFDRAWAETLLAKVRNEVLESYKKAGKEELVSAMLPWLNENAEPPTYREVANELGIGEGVLRVSVFRFREKFRTLLKEEILETIVDPRDLDGEIEYLIGLFSQ